MLIKIHKNRTVSSSGTWGTKNENNYEILNFEFPEELEEYNKRIVYYLDNQKVWDPIINNKAILTNAITTKGSVKAYIWCTKSDEAFETDVDFRTQIFVMNFFENDNADGIVPTPEQVDGFNTMLTAMNEKIKEIDELETTIENAETQRQENEETRQENESTRQDNEQTRQSQEADRERRTDEAIGNIKDKTAEYNQNAEAKTNDFNSNATSKTTDFNTNAENKTTAFNDNATQKTTNFDNNASSKTTTFNENATSKTNDFNDNATAKTTAFNDNAQAKTEAFDEHTAEITADIEDLQEEVEELSQNMPWNETEQATSIDITDAAKYSKNKMKVFGNLEQINYTGKNLFNIGNTSRESGGITWTPNSDGSITVQGQATGTNTYGITSSFAIEAGSYIASITNAIAKKIKFRMWSGTASRYYYSSIAIGNTKSSAITLPENVDWIQIYIDEGIEAEENIDLQFTLQLESGTEPTSWEPFVGGVPSPNPDYPQDIHVVTGNNSVGVTGKNILDTTLFSDNSFCIIGDKTNGKLQLQGKSNYYSGIFLEKQLKPSTQYTIQAKVTQIGTKSRGEIFIANSDYPQTGSIPSSGVRLATSNVLTETGDLLCTFTTDSTGIVNIFFDCNHDTTAGTITYENIQLEESSTTTPYEPYHLEEYPVNLGSIELCEKGDYQDYLYKENENWYKYGAIDKYVYNDDLTPNSLTESQIGMLSPELNLAGNLGGGQLGAISYCNIMRTTITNNTGLNGTTGAGKIRINMNTSYASSYNEFKQLCADNNLTIYFGAKVPVITQITDETLISQLEAIYNHLALVKGTNHITIIPSDLAPYMQLNYMQDQQKKFENIINSTYTNVMEGEY